jgi:hypothetical protein
LSKRPMSSFFALNRGSAQRLPNGNTLIVEATRGRIFEVTRDGSIVWEYIDPHFHKSAKVDYANIVYRAYRIASSWPEDEIGYFPW